MHEGQVLAVVGAGRGQVGLTRAAKRLGARVVVVTLPGGNLPAAAFADEIVHADITDPDAVERALKDTRIDGVATSCLDKGMQSLGRMRDLRDLRGPTEEAATRCNQKAKMKRTLAAAHVATADFELVGSISELEDAADRIGFPVVVKALDLNGSMGVRVCRDREELLAAYVFISGVSRLCEVLVEEFLEGVEVGAQALIADGNVVFVLPHGDQMHSALPTVPIGHTVPLALDQGTRRRLENQVIGGIRAMGLNDCAVNVDLMIDGGDVRIIELTGRVGANGLPELVSSWFGMDYYEVVARLALGEDVAPLFRDVKPTGAAGTRMLESPVTGALTEVRFEESLVEEVQMFVRPGDQVHKFENSSHCIGQALASATDVEAVLAALDGFQRSLVVEADE